MGGEDPAAAPVHRATRSSTSGRTGRRRPLRAACPRGWALRPGFSFLSPMGASYRKPPRQQPSSQGRRLRASRTHAQLLRHHHSLLGYRHAPLLVESRLNCRPGPSGRRVAFRGPLLAAWLGQRACFPCDFPGDPSCRARARETSAPRSMKDRVPPTGQNARGSKALVQTAEGQSQGRLWPGT